MARQAPTRTENVNLNHSALTACPVAISRMYTRSKWPTTWISLQLTIWLSLLSTCCVISFLDGSLRFSKPTNWHLKISVTLQLCWAGLLKLVVTLHICHGSLHSSLNKGYVCVGWAWSRLECLRRTINWLPRNHILLVKKKRERYHIPHQILCQLPLSFLHKISTISHLTDALLLVPFKSHFST